LGKQIVDLGKQIVDLGKQIVDLGKQIVDLGKQIVLLDSNHNFLGGSRGVESMIEGKDIVA
jgi:hypothetical protein